MTIFKNEKLNIEELSKRVEELEKLNKFVLLPGVENLMDEAMFKGTGALGNNPLRIWLNLKLCGANLSDESREYLQKLFETMDFSSYRPLRR